MHGFWRCALYLAVLGVAAHPLGQALPRKWFCAEKAPWRSAPWEKGGRIYLKLGIRKWKDHLPDMSRLMPDMVRKDLGSDPAVLVQETWRGRVRPLGADTAVGWNFFPVAQRLGGAAVAGV